MNHLIFITTAVRLEISAASCAVINFTLCTCMCEHNLRGKYYKGDRGAPCKTYCSANTKWGWKEIQKTYIIMFLYQLKAHMFFGIIIIRCNRHNLGRDPLVNLAALSHLRPIFPPQYNKYYYYKLFNVACKLKIAL